MDNQINEILSYIDPARLTYQEWINVGMGLKEGGYSVNIWDNWSKNDTRYHEGECLKKWETFQGSQSNITIATVVGMAKDNGLVFGNGENKELDWDSEISYEKKDELVIIDKRYVEGQELIKPKNFDPVHELIRYLETLFEASENVGYVTETWEKDGKFLPTKGAWDRTAGELIQALSECKGDIGAVIGDYNEKAGAWIRFNPLDGNGVKNSNVTEYRYALVESDSMSIEHQNALIRELELPVACLVYSGGKSIHAIVKIDAGSYEEYRKRVDYLYMVCEKNGLKIDTQNRNPSRLSRMPGVIRNGNMQYIIDTDIGKPNYLEWKDWIESVNDDLPDPENLSNEWDKLPELSPPLIENVLRQGHKMLIAGPSKAGKSFALIEMCIAIAEGTKWLSWSCTQGKILYVNLELDRASCLHRFKDVYEALEIKPYNISNIDIWNLRGKSVPMDKLAPKLIRRASKKNYIAIIIDPIYKVITGDENSADQMAHFCNQFDKVCTELGCAVIYCHHHSKGGQGGKKSMDRASGSGVFARDPDALLDLIELSVTDGLVKQQESQRVCKICAEWLKRFGLLDRASQDDLQSEKRMLDICMQCLNPNTLKLLNEELKNVNLDIASKTAWRIEGTLREFPKFPPVNLWFDYPVHRLDEDGVLQDIKPDGEIMPWNKTWKNNFKNKKTPEQRKKEKNQALQTAFSGVSVNGKCAIKELAEYMGVSEKTIIRNVKENEKFWIDNKECGLK